MKLIRYNEGHGWFSYYAALGDETCVYTTNSHEGDLADPGDTAFIAWQKLMEEVSGVSWGEMTHAMEILGLEEYPEHFVTDVEEALRQKGWTIETHLGYVIR